MDADYDYEFEETVFNIERCNWADEVEDSLDLEMLTSSTSTASTSDMSTSYSLAAVQSGPAVPNFLDRSKQLIHYQQQTTSKSGRGSRGMGGGASRQGVRGVRDKALAKLAGDKRGQKKKPTKGAKNDTGRPQGGRHGMARPGGKNGAGNGPDRRKTGEKKGDKAAEARRKRAALDSRGSTSSNGSASSKDSAARPNRRDPERRGSRADISVDWNADKTKAPTESAISAVEKPKAESARDRRTDAVKKNRSNNRRGGSNTARSGNNTARSGNSTSRSGNASARGNGGHSRTNSREGGWRIVSGGKGRQNSGGRKKNDENARPNGNQNNGREAFRNRNR